MSSVPALHMTCAPEAPPLYLHGFEGSVQGTKGRHLHEMFGSTGPEMPTYRHRTDEFGETPWCFEECFAIARDFVVSQPCSVLVGSSFGGAVTLALLQRGVWVGPVVLLAPAGALYGFAPYIPRNCHAIVIHDPADDVVPFEGSERLTKENDQRVELWSSDGGHRLHSVVESGLLERAVRAQVERAGALRDSYDL